MYMYMTTVHVLYMYMTTCIHVYDYCTCTFICLYSLYCHNIKCTVRLYIYISTDMYMYIVHNTQYVLITSSCSSYSAINGDYTLHI